MNGLPADPTGLAGVKIHGGGWTRKRWLAVIALIFVAHVGFIFSFGGRSHIIPRPVTNVPAWQLADSLDELTALENPTLFALPNPRDFASAVWLQMPGVTPPSFRWREPSHWLPLAAGNLGATFHRFMQTNYFATYPLRFKPPPKFSEPPLPASPGPSQNSTLRVAGELSKRQLLDPIKPPALPYDDVLAPTIVQTRVDKNGRVVSVVLLTSSGLDTADQLALKLARAARFAPAPRLTLGQLIFDWQTIPANAPAASP
jgi:TonB family protein